MTQKTGFFEVRIARQEQMATVRGSDLEQVNTLPFSFFVFFNCFFNYNLILYFSLDYITKELGFDIYT